MSEVGIFFEGLVTERDSEGYYIGKTASFDIWSDDQRFSIPIKIPTGVADHDLVAVARSKLHDVLRQCLEKTTEWDSEQKP